MKASLWGPGGIRGTVPTMVSRHPKRILLTAALALCACLATQLPAAVSGAGPHRRLRPAIDSRLIPFGPKRKREMAAYSQRHYGEHAWRLRHPRVIVEHV